MVETLNMINKRENLFKKLLIIGVFVLLLLLPLNTLAWIIIPDSSPPNIFNPQVSPALLSPGETLFITATITDESPFDAWADLGGFETITLNNLEGDLYGNSWQVPISTPFGIYTITITAQDWFGNLGSDSSLTFEVGENLPKKYAPNLWFDSEENYYPTTPFFYVDDIDEIDGELGKNTYYDKDFEEKKDIFNVYYHLAETEIKNVYEYWFYYVYNGRPGINHHYHDWERVFVFVDKDSGEVTRVVGSAHTWMRPNNVFDNPQFELSEHPGILVEDGSHASCTDRDNDGLFNRDIDVTNGYFAGIDYAHGIWFRDEDDKLNGYRILYNNEHYNLVEITDDFIAKFEGYHSFPNSPILGMFLVRVPVSGGTDIYLPVGGEPPIHPWYIDEYDDPEKIIQDPINYIFGKIKSKFGSLKEAVIAVFSDSEAFTFSDENGDFLINGLEEDHHQVVVNMEGYAPYAERFIIASNQELGVNGELNLIPEEEAFRLEGEVKEKGKPLVNIQVNIYDEQGSRVFTTLTDENGKYLFNLSSTHTYKVEAVKDDETISQENITSEPGALIEALLSFETPKWLKEQVIEKLESLKDNDGIKNKIIDNIIESITQSLDPSFWQDEWHLNDNNLKAHQVFLEELQAIKKLELLEKRFNLEIAQEIRRDLTKADLLLAQKSIEEVAELLTNLSLANPVQAKKIELAFKFLEQAKESLVEAEDHLNHHNFQQSILSSFKAWRFSEIAGKMIK